jgi:hypothetical protein
LAWKAKCHGSYPYNELREVHAALDKSANAHLHADFVEGTLALPLIEVVAGR